MTPPKRELRATIPAIALTPAEAAAAVGLGATFFDEHVAPDLAPIRIRGKRLYSVFELERWALERAQPVLGDERHHDPVQRRTRA